MEVVRRKGRSLGRSIETALTELASYRHNPCSLYLPHALEVTSSNPWRMGETPMPTYCKRKKRFILTQTKISIYGYL